MASSALHLEAAAPFRFPRRGFAVPYSFESRPFVNHFAHPKPAAASAVVSLFATPVRSGLRWQAPWKFLCARPWPKASLPIETGIAGLNFPDCESRHFSWGLCMLMLLPPSAQRISHRFNSGRDRRDSTTSARHLILHATLAWETLGGIGRNSCIHQGVQAGADSGRCGIGVGRSECRDGITPLVPSTGLATQELFLLKRHCDCVPFNFPQASAIVSKTRSYRKAGF